jgi:hypothetical protein
MELNIMRADPAEIPVTHRGNGAVTDALTQELTAFADNVAQGEWFKLEVPNVSVFATAVRGSATAHGWGATVRYQLSDGELVTMNRKGEEKVNIKQPGTVFWSYGVKREGVGRKKGSKNGPVTTSRVPVK